MALSSVLSPLLLVQIISSVLDVTKSPLTTYISVRVFRVVSKFYSLKRQHLSGQFLPSEGGLGMCVDSPWWGGIGFTSHKPSRIGIGVAMTLVVQRHDIQYDSICLIWV